MQGPDDTDAAHSPAQAPAPDASGALKRDREDQNGEECPVVDEDESKAKANKKSNSKIQGYSEQRKPRVGGEFQAVIPDLEPPPPKS
jgi:hypothetical protein